MEFLTYILAIITFLFLIFSKILKIILLYKQDKSIIREKQENDIIDFNVILEESPEEIVLYNPEENIFNVEFFRISFDGKIQEKLEELEIKKIIANQKILIITNTPCTAPNLMIRWENSAGCKITNIVTYNGKNGGYISDTKYKHNLKSILFYLFN